MHTKNTYLMSTYQGRSGGAGVSEKAKVSLVAMFMLMLNTDWPQFSLFNQDREKNICGMTNVLYEI